MHVIEYEEALERFRAKISDSFRAKDLADQFEVSRAFMSNVLSGRKLMTEPMLESVGIRRRVIYEVLDDNEEPKPKSRRSAAKRHPSS